VTIESFAGIVAAEGVDDEGPWSLAADVFVRARPEEMNGHGTFTWILRRGYVDALRRGAMKTTCTTTDGRTALVATLDRPDLGNPVLTFDARTAALTSLESLDESGRRSRVTFVRWGDAIAGWDARAPRLPLAFIERSPLGEETRVEIVADGTDRPCAHRADRGCVAVPSSGLAFDWATTEVHVPARFASDEILLRVAMDTSGAHTTWTLLDSGAGLSTLDTTTARGASFRPRGSVRGAAVAQTIEAGLGTLDAVHLGGLTAKSLPVAAVPIPALASFGELRPDLILGFSFFVGADVRIDRARGEVVFARPGTAPHAADALGVPFAIKDGRFVATVDVDGTPAHLLLDTGSSGSITVDARWAEAHGLLARPTTSLIASVGAGTGDSKRTLVRVRRAGLGALAIEAPLVDAITMPEPGDVVGLIGNEVFAMCAATVFDAKARTLWLEPPCRARAAESRAHWRLSPRTDAAGTHWVVEKLVPGGSAERAGIRAGDEIVKVGDVLLGSDPSALDTFFRGPPGTSAPVIVRRAGETRTVPITLVDLLPLASP
jgi:hypothetical protein